MLPMYSPSRCKINCITRDQLIILYFFLGYSYKEIIMSLIANQGISLSLRHLKRIIKSFGLHRRVNFEETQFQDIVNAIVKELQTSGKCLGYKSMWKKLFINYGIRVRRNTVLEIMRVLDPDGIARRKAHRLIRRRYSTPGPNFIWHLDGYDKLKPYGFAIHGAIDGFSRRILWLEVGLTNNDPVVISTYYLQCVAQMGKVPRIIRCDPGTENTGIKYLQPFFRKNDNDIFSNKNSFITGKSTANQRIESWWSILRRQCIDFWINFFKDFRDSGVYNTGNAIHQECLRYCFMPVLQLELHNVAMRWNVHNIEKRRNADGFGGKPDIMFFSPEIYDCQDYGVPINSHDLKDFLTNTSTVERCCNEFSEIVALLYPNVETPKVFSEALYLYVDIIRRLENFI